MEDGLALLLASVFKGRVYSLVGFAGKHVSLYLPLEMSCSLRSPSDRASGRLSICPLEVFPKHWLVRRNSC